MHAVPNEVLGGKYRIVRTLGEGGMGIVAEAVHLGLGHRVALKLLRSELVRPDHRERFFREARAADSLRSEHVVAIKDVDTLPDGTPFLVMEYLEGTDLGRLVQQRGPLPVEAATDYVLQACHALAEAHAQGIVHRDLKPANLFLSRRPDGSPLVKVLDFGIAKIAGTEPARDLTSTSQYMGSPSYMSPEQVRSAKRVDARTDLWALGVILYELVVGALPFDGETAGDVLVKISTEPPRRFAPPVPAPGLEAIILRCLEKDPDRRYRDIGELAVALAPFAGVTGRARAEPVVRIVGRELPPILPLAAGAPASMPLTVTTLGMSSGQLQAGAPRRRSGRLALGAIAVVILAGAATAGYLKASSGEPPPASRAAAPIPTAPTPTAPTPTAPTPTAPTPTAPTPTALAPAAQAGLPPATAPAPSANPAPVAPAATIAPVATIAPADPAPATAARPAAAPAGAVEIDAGAPADASQPPRKPRGPGRRPGAKPAIKDSDFVEDRR